MWPIPNGFRVKAILLYSTHTVHYTDEKDTVSSHELQSALMLAVEFSKMYCTLLQV
jgi:hypothetical protein